MSFIALQPGFSDRSLFEVVVPETKIDHRFSEIVTSSSFSRPLFFSQVQTRFGGDPIGLRYKLAETGSLLLKIEEERSADNEIRHLPKAFAYWIFFD